MNLVERVKNILLTPKTEWPVIAAEPATVPDLYKSYIAIVAAIPALAGFVKGSLIGYRVFGGTFHVPFFSGLLSAVLNYALGLAAVYVMALIVDALAPTFGGQKNRIQAIKVVAYAWSASWVASIGLIIPWFGALIGLAGMVYSIILLYRGLPVLMQCPPEKAGGYTALTFVCALGISLLIAFAMGSTTGAGARLTMSGSGAPGKSDSAASIDALKKAVANLNLAGPEALKNQGVHKS